MELRAALLWMLILSLVSLVLVLRDRAAHWRRAYMDVSSALALMDTEHARLQHALGKITTERDSYKRYAQQLEQRVCIPPTVRPLRPT